MDYRSQANAWDYYSRHFNLICEYLGLHSEVIGDTYREVHLFEFTHEPSGDTFLVERARGQEARTRLIDKYHGLPHNTIPIYEGITIE